MQDGGAASAPQESALLHQLPVDSRTMTQRPWLRASSSVLRLAPTHAAALLAQERAAAQRVTPTATAGGSVDLF